jgi:hypothetical protein
MWEKSNAAAASNAAAPTATRAASVGRTQSAGYARAWTAASSAWTAHMDAALSHAGATASAARAAGGGTTAASAGAAAGGRAPPRRISTSESTDDGEETRRPEPKPPVGRRPKGLGGGGRGSRSARRRTSGRAGAGNPAERAGGAGRLKSASTGRRPRRHVGSRGSGQAEKFGDGHVVQGVVVRQVPLKDTHDALELDKLSTEAEFQLDVIDEAHLLAGLDVRTSPGGVGDEDAVPAKHLRQNRRRGTERRDGLRDRGQSGHLLPRGKRRHSPQLHRSVVVVNPVSEHDERDEEPRVGALRHAGVRFDVAARQDIAASPAAAGAKPRVARHAANEDSGTPRRAEQQTGCSGRCARAAAVTRGRAAARHEAGHPRRRRSDTTTRKPAKRAAGGGRPTTRGERARKVSPLFLDLPFPPTTHDASYPLGSRSSHDTSDRSIQQTRAAPRLAASGNREDRGHVAGIGLHVAAGREVGPAAPPAGQEDGTRSPAAQGGAPPPGRGRPHRGPELEL